MVLRRAIKTGEECDVHEWRRYLVWHRGEVKAVKRRTNRRERHDADQEVRAYVSQLWAKDWDSPEDAAYDWVDDDTLSREETERLFDALMDEAEPIEVVTRRPDEDRTRD